MGEYSQAIAVLDTVDLEVLPEPERGESMWTLYFSLRKLDLHERADFLLDSLAVYPGEIGERARRMRPR
jgi:hypothetical protein